MTIRDIGILFGYKVDQASEQKVEGSIKSLKSMASKVLGAVGITLLDGRMRLVDLAANRLDFAGSDFSFTNKILIFKRETGSSLQNARHEVHLQNELLQERNAD